MLRHLIRPPRKTEPVLIVYLRIFVILTSLLLLIGSTTILCIRMSNEQPTLSSTLNPINNLSAPAIHLGFPYNFVVTCSLYYDYNGTMADNCDDRIIETKKIGHDDYPYVGKFAPKNINLSGYNNYDHTEPIFVFLRININDPSFPTTFNDSAQQSSFRMIAYDSENEYDTMNKDFDDTLISPFEKSLFYINKHTLSRHFIYKFGFSKKVRKTLIESTLAYFGYFGFPNYDTKPYIESRIQAVPMSDSNFDFVNVRIGPQYFVLEDEYEQRNDTIIDILGSVAALYSSIVFLYVFLFGVESMRPWGVVHGCCGGRYGFRRLRTETQEKLVNIIESDFEEKGSYMIHIRKKCYSMLVNFVNLFRQNSTREVEVQNDLEGAVEVEVQNDLEEAVEEMSPNLDNLLRRINYLEEFNNFLKSDVIDITLLNEFKKYEEDQQEQDQHQQVRQSEVRQPEVRQLEVRQQEDRQQEDRQQEVRQQEDRQDQDDEIVETMC